MDDAGQHCDRIACPLDIKHSIARDQLWKHLHKCTTVRDSCGECLQPCYTYEVNSINRSTPYLAENPPSERPTLEDVNSAIRLYLPRWKHKTRASRSDRFEEEGSAALDYAEKYVDKLYAGMIQYVCEDTVCKKNIRIDEMLKTFDSFQRSEDIITLGRQQLDVLSKPLTDTILAMIDRYDLKSVQALYECSNLKHELQGYESLMCILDLCPNLKDYIKDSLFIEVGAGKGGMLQWLIQYFKALKHTGSEYPMFVLVEREARKNVRENKNGKAYRDESLDRMVVRLRVDLEHFDCTRLLRLDLANVYDPKNCPWILRILHRAGVVKNISDGVDMESYLQRFAKQCNIRSEPLMQKLQDYGTFPGALDRPGFFLAKHLCGDAFDVTLKMIAALSSNRDIYCCLIPCCYHRCENSLGFSYIYDQLSLIGGEMESFRKYFKRIISWSTSGRDKKMEFGKKLKLCVLIGRLVYIAHAGYDIRVVQYTDSKTTQENLTLLLKRMGKANIPS